jgi:hypothetical protein
MRKALLLSILLAFTASACVIGQGKSTKIRGTVLDAATRKPVAGATVSAAGDVASQSEVTDDRGFFRLVINGVSPGDLVRIRIEKSGYAVFDRNVAVSEEIPLTVHLRRPQAAASSAAGGREVKAPVDPIDAHYIQLLKDPLEATELNALQVLEERAPTDPAAMSAVIASEIAFDYRVKLSAIDTVARLRPKSRLAITNLIISLNDVEPLVRNEAAAALGQFPKDKDAVSALFSALGTPPNINVPVMTSLNNLGIDDPRLTAALLQEVWATNDYAVNAVLKKAPLSPNLIGGLMALLQRSLPSARNYEQQSLVRVLLEAGGNPAHQALRRFLAGATPVQQARLTLTWLEVDHNAKAEILQDIRAADVAAELGNAMSSTNGEAVYLTELVPRHGAYATGECPYGVRLRAAMGVLVLGLPAREQAWTTLLDVLRTSVVNSESEYTLCADYSATVPGWLDPTAAKPAIPLLLTGLGCGIEKLSFDTAVDTLSKIGDEDTITEIEQLQTAGKIPCGDDKGVQAKLNALIASIRNRTSHVVNM